MIVQSLPASPVCTVRSIIVQFFYATTLPAFFMQVACQASKAPLGTCLAFASRLPSWRVKKLAQSLQGGNRSTTGKACADCKAHAKLESYTAIKLVKPPYPRESLGNLIKPPLNKILLIIINALLSPMARRNFTTIRPFIGNILKTHKNGVHVNINT